MRLYFRRKKLLTMKRASIIRQTIIILIAFLAACLLGGLVVSCRSEPDAFDRMFEAAAQQNVARMREPMRQTKTWQEWKEAAK